jgi:hypothetical protein
MVHNGSEGVERSRWTVGGLDIDTDTIVTMGIIGIT